MPTPLIVRSEPVPLEVVTLDPKVTLTLRLHVVDNRRTRGEGPRENSDETDDVDKDDEGGEQLPVLNDEQLDTHRKGETDFDEACDEWKDIIQSEQTI